MTEETERNPSARKSYLGDRLRLRLESMQHEVDLSCGSGFAE